MLERYPDHHLEVVDNFLDTANANIVMTTRDYVVRPTASTTPVVITLPPVAEAKGRLYSILVVDADITNTVTVQDNDDSENWIADLVFNEAKQGVLALSDGRKWILTSMGIHAEYFTSSRTDGGGVIRTETSALVLTGASATNMAETARFTLTSNVETGVYVNAICGVINYSTAGYAIGSAAPVCSELDMPGGAIPGGHGTYWVYEAELNLPTGFVGGGVPIAIFGINVWGAEADQFDDSGFIFDISGVTKASGKVFQDNTAAAASQALRCRINGTAYYIMLTSTGA